MPTASDSILLLWLVTQTSPWSPDGGAVWRENVLANGSLRVRPWPPLRATTQQPCVRRAAQFRPHMVMPTAPYQGHPNTSILGAGAGPSPVRVSLQMSKGASINTQVLETAWPQGGHACPAPPHPTLTSGTQSSISGLALLYR